MGGIVTPNDVLTGDKKGNVFYNGRALQKQEIESLRAEAVTIQGTLFWKLIVNEGKYHAQKRVMVDAAKELDDTKKLGIINQAHAQFKVIELFEKFLLQFLPKN